MRKVPTLIPPDIESPERLRAYLDDLERRRLDFPTFTLSDGQYTRNVYDDLQIEGVGMSPMGTGQRGMYLTLGKNKLIGCDFSLNPWVRGTTFAAIASGSYCADRWVYVSLGAGVVTIQKTADAPTPVQTNGYFTQHCLDVDVTTADASLAASDLYVMGQIIEGYNVQKAGFGQTGTRYVTLSFWVKSTVTGTFCVSLSNSASNRCIIKEYTVSAADTWEKKVLTFPTDTTGTWLYDSGVGLRVYWALASGTDFQGSADAWSASGLYATSNQANALSSTSNNFKIALCQLEFGQAASAFEQVDGASVEIQCFRYLPHVTADSGIGDRFVGAALNTTTAYGVVYFPVLARVSPTGITVSNAGHWSTFSARLGASGAASSVVFVAASRRNASIANGTTAGSPTLAAGDSTLIFPNNASGQILFTGCEL